MSRTPLRAGVVGLGWWGRTIVRTLAGNPMIRLAAAADRDPAAAAFAAEHGLAFATELDALLSDPALDAIILCTPHTQHAAQVQAVAAAGKHVFCEKPLCLTAQDAADAIAACNRAGVTLGVGHERRFEPPVLELRRLLESGALGTPLQIEANFSQDKFLSLPPENWRLSGAEAPAGPMTATGIHVLDLAVSLLGPAATALAQVRTLGSGLVNGDTLGMLIGFESGANALISAILATPFDGRFAIYGNEGWAEVRDRAHPEQPEGWTLTLNRRQGGRSVQDFPPASSVGRNLEAWATAATGGAPYPMTQTEMLNTVSALEAVFRSATSGAVERVVTPALEHFPSRLARE
ncbi:MAG: Gfo/Idh/MocA family oxidoreductase [Acetobacteraceae bacterium]